MSSQGFENWSGGKALLQLNEFMALLKVGVVSESLQRLNAPSRSQHYKVFELGSEGDAHDMARRVEQVRVCFMC